MWLVKGSVVLLPWKGKQDTGVYLRVSVQSGSLPCPHPDIYEIPELAPSPNMLTSLARVDWTWCYTWGQKVGPGVPRAPATSAAVWGPLLEVLVEPASFQPYTLLFGMYFVSGAAEMQRTGFQDDLGFSPLPSWIRLLDDRHTQGNQR